MKHNQNDLLVLNLFGTELILSTKQDDKSKMKPCSNEPEQEGSLQTIEKPQEHNDNTILKTEAQIEEADNKKDSLCLQPEPINAKQQRVARIPFDFFSHIRENRTINILNVLDKSVNHIN